MLLNIEAINVDQLAFDFMCDHKKVRSILYVNTKSALHFVFDHEKVLVLY